MFIITLRFFYNFIGFSVWSSGSDFLGDGFFATVLFGFNFFINAGQHVQIAQHAQASIKIQHNIKLGENNIKNETIVIKTTPV